MKKWLLLLGTTIAAPAVARGQVGYNPAHSPYRDIDQTQEVSFFSGYYKAKADVAHVAPRSGPMMGVHYQWRASGPANFSFDVSRVSSQRLVLDPQQPRTCTAKPDCRSLGLYNWPLYFFDGALDMSLTGARTFHDLAPEVKGGFGLASDFHNRPDLGDFGFGTRFAFLYGLGLRWIPGGRYAIRADFLNHLYTVKYPQSYYQSASDSTQILAPKQKRSVWLNNPGLTIGVSYLFAR